MDDKKITPSKLVVRYECSPDRSRYYNVYLEEEEGPHGAIINENHVLELLSGDIPDSDDVKHITKMEVESNL